MSDFTRILIASQSLGEIEAELLDKNPQTSEAIQNALPFEGAANVWGDEVFFDIPVTAKEEDSQKVMEVGDIAFWPLGSAMCVFFGPTPVSEGDEPRAYSPVNLFARVMGDTEIFKNVRDGEIIQVRKKIEFPAGEG